MIHVTRALIHRWLGSLLHIDDTPERTAAAFAIGVCFGFSPLLGFHTLMGVGFAFLLNLNRVAVLLGVYSNLPWFMAPYYAAATMVGKEITGHSAPFESIESQLRDVFRLSLLHGEFWERLMVVVTPLVVPFAVGSTLGALLLATAAYHLALAFIASRRRLHDIMHHRHRQQR